MYKLIIVDDHPLLRKGIKQLLAMDAEFEVVAEASNGLEALDLCQSADPDLVLLDLNMKGMSGIEVLKALRAAGISSHIVVFTVSDHQDDVVTALRSGADGYLLKDMEPEALLEAIRKAASGEMVISPQLSGVLATAFRPADKQSGDLLTRLSERERQILRLIATGQSNKAIGRALDITEATVKVHVKHLLKKLELKSRVEAAVWAVRQSGNL